MTNATLTERAQNEDVPDDPAAKPTRRRFTAAYKLAVLAEYEELTEPGTKGALLRREGLYSSHIIEWRRAKEAGVLSGLAAKPRRSKRSTEQKELEKLRRRNEHLEDQLAKHREALEIQGKASELLSRLLAESDPETTQQPEGEIDAVIEACFSEIKARLGTKAACQAVGRPRASHYRRKKPGRTTPRTERPSPANKLTDAEIDAVLAHLRSERFVDCSPDQVYFTLLDEGIYVASVSSFYRILRSNNEVRERRRQATHPAKKKPELVATAPNMCWSWDITKLKAPKRGEYYDLYVVIDIFSRYVVAWCIAPSESGELAKELIADAVAFHNVEPGQLTIHADRGSSMTSNPVVELLTFLGIKRSHSRPHVSNDNPYSESQFKTLKYCSTFPERFGSIEDARAFCGRFFEYYNHEHKHSGIGYHTPASVHFGTATEVRTRRAETLEAAFAANPDRFRHRLPEPPKLPTVAWINEPVTVDEEPSAAHQPEGELVLAADVSSGGTS